MTVTSRTREIEGVVATVVPDKVTERGELVENTFDWYAQDRCGNVWYLGENTKEYEDGKVVTTAGSWEAGVDGEQAGVVMPADPSSRASGQAHRRRAPPNRGVRSAWIGRPAVGFRLGFPFGSVIASRAVRP